MSTLRIGVALRDAAAVAVRVRRGTPECVENVSRAEDESTEAFVARALASVHQRTWRTPRVGVCVADHRCRVIPLHGEPVDSRRDEVKLRFAAAPEHYAIAGTDGLVAGTIWRHDDAWNGVVLSAQLSRALSAACASLGVELVGVAPSTDPGRDELADLASLAADFSSADPVIVDPTRAAREQRRVRRRRIAMLAATGIGLMWGVIAPPVVRYRAMRARETVAAEAAVVVAEEGSTGTRARLAALSTLGDRLNLGRGRTSTLLHDLAAAMPDSSAIAALRIDGSGGTVTLVAPRVAESVKRLTGLHAMRGARVSGSILEEDHQGLILQRVTLIWPGSR